jgi:hypothetical protein
MNRAAAGREQRWRGWERTEATVRLGGAALAATSKHKSQGGLRRDALSHLASVRCRRAERGEGGTRRNRGLRTRPKPAERGASLPTSA